MSKGPIRAAGAVVVRLGPGGEQIVVVHRPRFDDWTLPKGKPHRGEPLVCAAVREVEEETGVRIRLEARLTDQEYQTDRGPKVVCYWRGQPLQSRPRRADDEVDEVRWLDVPAALQRLTYHSDRAVVGEALTRPSTTPLLVIRHATAVSRKEWHHLDSRRPLTSGGRTEAEQLASLLAAFDVRRLVSSPSTRCVQTLIPYARQLGIPIEAHPVLSEEEGLTAAAAVIALVNRLRMEGTGRDVATAICGHRPVLPKVLAAGGLPEGAMEPAEIAVAQVGVDGTVHTAERIRP